MTRVTGVDQHLRRLTQRAKAVRQEVGKAVMVAAELVAAEAVASITADWISGPDHVPSDPGEPPNADTGRLHRAIDVVRRGELSADVVSAAPYGDLEFGTARAAARPYLRPATAKKRQDAVALIVQAVRRGRAGK
jgi:hypothetical protein